MPRSSGTLRAIRRAGQQGRVRSQLSGVAGVRKLIRQLPASVKTEMADTLEDIGPDYLAAVKTDTPVASAAHRKGYEPGALRAALSFKVLRSSLRLRVGLLGRKKLFDFFYGRIIELGRKAQTVTVNRYKVGARATDKGRYAFGSGGRKSSTHTVTYQLPVKARAAHPFVYKKRPQLRTRLSNRLNNFWEHALQHAGEGTDIDG